MCDDLTPVPSRRSTPTGSAVSVQWLYALADGTSLTDAELMARAAGVPAGVEHLARFLAELVDADRDALTVGARYELRLWAIRASDGKRALFEPIPTVHRVH